ncbi:MAG: XRE family transcriptional regulator [Desulfomonilaceae bacterium]|nr:XRE family transcriptional regulator [Desulfomonilaceae bacterium]
MDSIGSRLRTLRNSQGLSLKQVAERVGCTPSYLSMVENGKLDPSASRLKKIADALGFTIIELFSEQSNGAEVVLRKEERQRVAVRGSKLLIEILVRQSPGKQIDARLAIVAPGGGSEGDYTHPGEEFGFIVKGTLELTVDGATHILREGDTFYFESTRPHRFRNTTDENVEIVWVNHPPSW